MKAITIQQPWAWCIIYVEGAERKDIENRSWDTKIRGTIAIHAGKSRQKDLLQGIIEDGFGDELHFGSIIGVVDIVDVVTEYDSEWFEGPFGFVLANPRELPEPIPFKGQLGFWNVPTEIEEQINTQLKPQKRKISKTGKK